MKWLLRAFVVWWVVAAGESAAADFGNELNFGASISAVSATNATWQVASLADTPQLPNLTVRAQKFEALLYLNTSWVHPPGEPRGTSKLYHLTVKSLAKSEEIYCQPNMSVDKFLIPPMTNTLLMPPPSLDPPTSSTFRVKAGCTYRLTLWTSGSPARVDVDYTVPDCVGSICDCHRFQDAVRPEVEAAARMESDKLNITWSYPPDSLHITNFNVALKESQNGEHFFGHKLIGRAQYAASNALRTTRYTRVVKLPFALRNNVTYRVEVTVEDEARRCHGHPGGALLEALPVPTLPSTEKPFASSEVMVTVLSSFTFVLACCLALAMVRKRCCGWFLRRFVDRNVQPIQWQGIYKAVGSDNARHRPNFPSMQHSVIYVEKEIEEAKARGDADTLEVSYTRLEMGGEIGKGAFGCVFIARAECIAGQPGFMPVAVKKLKNKAKNDEVEEFLSEIAMLKRVGRHPNIVTLLGCVTLRQPYCMIMEFVPCGDLLQYLRQLRVEYERRTGAALPCLTTRARPPRSPRYVDLALSSDSDASYVQPAPRTGRPSIAETEWSLLTNDSTTPLTPPRHPGSGDELPLPPPPPPLEYVLDPKELQNFAVQIARGMEHLEAKQITHRDLAARNVLIDERKTLKISDFGLSRSGIYVNTKRKKVPLRWLSVEAMRDNLYSSKSDVWAFAIVLWEIGTLGGFPYPTIADYDLLAYLLDGKRLDKPDNCTDELYSLMLVCWSRAADSRPTFADLVSHLDSVICRRRVYVDFDRLRPDYTFPPTEQTGASTDSASTPGEQESSSASAAASVGE